MFKLNVNRHPNAPRGTCAQNPLTTRIQLMAMVVISALISLSTAGAEPIRPGSWSATNLKLNSIVTGTWFGEHGNSQPFWNPVPESRPKLGFDGRMVPGRGMLVINVRRGTTAFRMGLEPGDIILRVNGQAVTTVHRWRQLLYESVEHLHGRVTLKVDNVRARQGAAVPRFVSVTGWLDGNVHLSAASIRQTTHFTTLR